jgi:1,2-diacylglycerol 3-beta-galactosyltransferase
MSQSDSVKKLDFFYFEAGGGHRAAAQALHQVSESQHRPWDVQLMNLQQLLLELDVARKWFNIHMEDIYNLLLKKGWTLGMAQMKKVLGAVVRFYHPAEVRELSKHFAARRPDLVVSLIPNFNRALYESLVKTCPGSAYVTILTDFADFPPRFWIEAHQRQYFICGTERAVSQAKAMGHDDSRIFLVSGMILNPRFYEPVNVDRAAERTHLGLEADLPTALVLFGGEGSPAMLRVARLLSEARLPMQAIYICGRNAGLAERLKSMTHAMPVRVEGFTREIPRYMALADFFIGKPGPGSISEAVAMRLPVIVDRNAWTMPQERYNADWVIENDLGLVVKSFDNIADAVRKILEPATLARVQANAAARRNRAVFEIPEILERILSHG